jgi:hypothetical protein
MLNERFRLLIEIPRESPRLEQIEQRLKARSLVYRRRWVEPEPGRSGHWRLLVARRHLDIAFRVLFEMTAEVVASEARGTIQ